MRCELCGSIVSSDDYQRHMENHRQAIEDQEREELNKQSNDILENLDKSGI
jgi:hypothetical protein